jgi:hypothetical protein
MSSKYIIYWLSVVCVRLLPHTYTLCVYLCGGASGTYTIRKCEPYWKKKMFLFLKRVTIFFYIIRLAVGTLFNWRLKTQFLGQDTSVQWRDSYKAEIPKGEKSAEWINRQMPNLKLVMCRRLIYKSKRQQMMLVSLRHTGKSKKSTTMNGRTLFSLYKFHPVVFLYLYWI